ncbi:uncharacterized protein N7479_004961 [Penicillium vulpinum]|uniref:DUF7580 domain-containing protein n=1 Tax=Penicillium vulpinum TaxID=29845 RepID=A0A1V6RH26_9EURO|nr:uncharacterized protein N7479_004961 [Penicillium vulpinum]KAJ5965085.1 hypothetical protein N7479_004961 [Penicillium vulpinum]OQE00693.1 hypothetical protein PENVUL_c047G01380 [Penicillium vulpinum]
MGLNTHHAILQCTLEKVLENVVNDEEAVAVLIQNPQGDGWETPSLKTALQHKLGRNFRLFHENMNSLSELLERLSRKLELPAMKTDHSSTDFRSFRKFWKILSRAVYDDLLGKIEAPNTTLRMLVEQENHQEERRERRTPWTSLLRRYQNERQHIESLFQTVSDSCWQSHCREHHCVHLPLQPYPTEYANNPLQLGAEPSFHFIFSNIHTTSQMGVWDWREVIFKPRETDNSQNYMPPLAGQSRQQKISDLCSSLQSLKPLPQEQTTIGFISEGFNPTYRYTMHAVQSLQRNPRKQTLSEALTSCSRRDRLYIAASIACAVLQYHGNWLTGRWDSSNFHLAAETLNSLYLSWPLSTLGATKAESTRSNSAKREAVLQSLGVSLVELSLGRPLDVLLSSKDESHDRKKMIIDSVLNITKEVRLESGWHYASVVDSCLSWSGVSSICRESHSFEERIFDKIVSPLLKDVMVFDGRT